MNKTALFANLNIWLKPCVGPGLEAKLLLALLCFAALPPMASAQVLTNTYLDATTGASGNTTTNGVTYTPPLNGTTGLDNQWEQRTPLASGGNVYESAGESGGVNENAPELTTKISGLTPGAKYQVYVLFWDPASTGEDWNIRAGFTSNPGGNTRFSATDATGDFSPAATGAILASNLVYLSAPTTPTIFFEGARDLRAGLIGTNTANGSGELFVYIDDGPAAGSVNRRTWYDGVAYAKIPDPNVGPTTISPPVVAVGGSATVTATVGGTAPFFFQWLSNSIPVLNATNQTLNLISLQVADSGASYSLVVSNNPGGTPTVVTNTPAVLSVVVPANLVWYGSASSDWNFTDINWDTNVNLTADVAYTDLSNARFDDTAVAFALTLGTNVFPGSIVVSNEVQAYSITGSGGIAGTTALSKQGASSLTLGTANTFSGATTISNGSVIFGANNVLGSGPVTVSGASSILDLGASQTDTVGTVTVAGGASITGSGTSALITTGSLEMQQGSVAVILAGAGAALNKTGAGTVVLSKANTYTGPTTVNQGTLELSSLPTIGSSSNLTINNGGTVTLSAYNPFGAPPTVPVFINTGGTLTMSGNFSVNMAAITLNGGTLNSGGFSDPTYGSYYLNANVVVTNGTSTISAVNVAGPGQRTFTVAAGSQLDVTGTFSGIFGAFGLTKAGPGRMVLSGVNTYTNQTIVSEGTLALAVGGTIDNSAIINVASNAVLETAGTLLLAAGQVLGGNGTVSGSVDLNTSGVVAPGGVGTAGTLTITTNLALTTGTLRFDLSSTSTAVGGGTNDLITVGGSVSATAPVTVQVGYSSTPAAGTYTLIRSTGTISAVPADFTLTGLAGSAVFVVDNASNPKTVSVTITPTPQNLVWTGLNSADWDFATLNWTNLAGLNTNFFDWDTVRFDDSTFQTSVNIPTPVSPARVTVDTASTYSFSGSAIGGSGALTKSGTGTLTLNVNNAYSGGTTNQGGGVISVANNLTTPVGSGPLTLIGSTFDVANSSARTIANPIVAAGTASTINKTGAGTLTLSGAMTGSSSLQFSNSDVTLRGVDLSGNNTAFNGNVAIVSPVFLRFQSTNASSPNASYDLGNSAGTVMGPVNSTGAAATYRIGALSGGSTTILRGHSSSAAGNNITWEIGALGLSTTFDGNMENGNAGATTSALTKVGAGKLTLTGSNTYSAGTIISAGTLEVNNTAGSGTGAGSVTVNGGVLAGTGIVTGPVAINASGTLAPGSSIGTLTISNTLSLLGSVLAEVSLDGGITNNDKVIGLSSVAYGGTLVVTNTGATPFSVGVAFPLFSAATAGTGNFTGVTLQGPGASGLTGVFNRTNGVLTIASGIASYPTNLSVGVSGGDFTVSWPATHLGWLLDRQTNSLAVGLSTNWQEVVGSASVTSTNFPLNSAPVQFFRMRKP